MFLERLLCLGMGTVVYRCFYVFRKTAVSEHGNCCLQIFFMFLERLLGMGTVVYRYFYVFRKTAVPGHGNCCLQMFLCF
jgi:hypothetical protein